MSKKTLVIFKLTAMKTSRFIFALAAASIAFASCSKESSTVQNNDEKTVNFVAESIDTKTAFGAKDTDGYPTLWTENDSKVKVSLNFETAKDVTVTPSQDFKTASFAGSFTDDKPSYTFLSLSPSSAFVAVSKEYSSFTILFPTAQTPSATSVDESAQILVAKSSTFSTLPSNVAFTYSHVTAYGKMSLSNLNLSGADITSISLTAAENWAGRWFYYFDKPIEANSASGTITINTSSASDIWFACAPVDLSGKKIALAVNTTAGVFEKEIIWPAGKPFTSGKVYKFAVDMSGISPSGTKTYSKVTSKSEITLDSELIVVADDYDFALSTTQNGNNRGNAGVDKSEDKATIQNPGPDVQVFTAKAGSKNNTLAFYTGSGYIFAASSSSNYLRTQDNLDDNASFTLSISGGVALLTAQGEYTRNVIQYNDVNGIFSCYGSASQKKVSIYKLDGSGTQTPIFQAVPKHTVSLGSHDNGTITATVGGNEITSWPASLEEGTEISITATPDTGYDFSSWSITGASAASSSATTTVTVGTSDITIGASFTQQGQGGKETCLDMTTKSVSCNAYNTSTTYGDWKIVNGANNNKQWPYFKMGGKKEIISSYNPCYIYNTEAISHSVKKITVHLPSGSLSKSGMSVNSWGVYVYSDKNLKNEVDYVAGGTITKNEGTFTFTPSDEKTWNANYYYKISWNLANTTSTNGIICVDKITLSEEN